MSDSELKVIRCAIFAVRTSDRALRNKVLNEWKGIHSSVFGKRQYRSAMFSRHMYDNVYKLDNFNIKVGKDSLGDDYEIITANVIVSEVAKQAVFTHIQLCDKKPTFNVKYIFNDKDDGRVQLTECIMSSKKPEHVVELQVGKIKLMVQEII